MKNTILFLCAMYALCLNVNAKYTRIYRDKVGGDKTNKFETVSRTSDNGTDIETIRISCVNPGDNYCPTARPVSNPPPNVGNTNLDPALANALENIYVAIDNSFESGNNVGEVTTTLVIVNNNGSTTTYIVKYKWYLVGNDIQRSEIEIEEPLQPPVN